MRHALLSLFTLLMIFTLAGCATNSEPTPIAVRVGMSRDDLRLFFGSPLRIDSRPSGEEDWIYTLRSAPTAEVQTTVENNGTNVVRSTSVAYSSLKNKYEAPIHLSADGHVIEPLPEGTLIRR